MQGLLIRKEKYRNTDTERRQLFEETGVMQLQGKRGQQLPEARKGQGRIFPRNFRESIALPTSSF